MADIPRNSLLNLHAALEGRYRVERELGAGGMATVYLAHDVKHDRKVALKVLRPELAAALGAERFLREITTTANLRHPHILPLYDSGRTEADEDGQGRTGFLYYVMPFVEGESLRDRLNRERQLPLDDALQIAREVADALSYAHSRGVIHRDIKPENILLESGHAVVADFGIARAVDAAGGAQLTETGLAIGTPTYMSPEQAAGERELDGRSDLYALGCVLYEMLGGQPPFTGPTVESVVHQHLVVAPRPVTDLRPAVPGPVSAALQRALSKSPADRFNPVAHFAEALHSGHVTSTAPERAPAAGRAPWRRPAVVAAAALLVVLAAAAFAVFGRRAPPGGGVTPSVAVLPFVDLSGGAAEYLGDGMAETLINALSGVQGLRVAARTSAFTFKGKSEDVRSIGQALGVGAVLEGSVQRSGDRLRITAQLINASDGFHLWSQSFDRDAADVFAVQDEVARAVVAALEVRLVGADSGLVVNLGTTSVAAYQAYLQGLFFWNKRTTADVERSAEYYRQAVDLDPEFAAAWAGLASAYVLFVPSEYEVRSIPFGEALDRADEAARRALALDPGQAAAHTALALAYEKRGMMEESGASYRRAIEADPRYPTARQWYATYLAMLGRTAEGVEQIQAAARLDPLSLVILVEVGELLQAAGRRDAATAAYEHVLGLYPGTYLVNYFAGIHFLQRADYARAADLLSGFMAAWNGDSVQAWRLRGAILDPRIRDSVLRLVADSSTRPELASAIHLRGGDEEAAIVALERAVEGPDFERIYLPHSLAVLGPELVARPRTQAAIERFFQRLREQYGRRRPAPRDRRRGQEEVDRALRATPE
jgi:serine/threonine-protein kinase